MSRLRLIVIGGWVLMFGAGFAFGRFVTQERNSSETTYLDRLATQYDLSPDQVQDIGGFLDEEGRRIDEILSGVEASVRKEIQEAREATVQKISERLDSEQRQQFEQDRSSRED
jgi:hypothetical protein